MPDELETSAAWSLAYALKISETNRELIEQLSRQQNPPSSSDLFILCVANAKTNAWLLTALTAMLVGKKEPEIPRQL